MILILNRCDFKEIPNLELISFLTMNFCLIKSNAIKFLQFQGTTKLKIDNKFSLYEFLFNQTKMILNLCDLRII